MVATGTRANMCSLPMRPRDQVKLVVDLAGSGKSPLAISRATGIPRSTIRDWLVGRVPNGRAADESACPACGAPQHRFESLPPEYVYLLGLYLGDGCISAHPRGVYRLRLFFDVRYPEILAAGEAAVRSVFPANRINRLSRSGGYENSAPRSNVELSVYSKSLLCLFPQHGPGRKHERPIVLEDWQSAIVDAQPAAFLRGLFHSDGSRVANWATRVVAGERRRYDYPRWQFTNNSADIRGLCCAALDLVDVAWRQSNWKTISVSRRADVARLDELIGPKR
jgi:hypothetical protein